MSNHYDIIHDVLADWGIGERVNNGPHSWRCEYPDRFGECDCLSGLINSIIEGLERWGQDDED